MQKSILILIKLADKYDRRLRNLEQEDRSLYQNLFTEEPEFIDDDEEVLFPSSFSDAPITTEPFVQKIIKRKTLSPNEQAEQWFKTLSPSVQTEPWLDKLVKKYQPVSEQKTPVRKKEITTVERKVPPKKKPYIAKALSPEALAFRTELENFAQILEGQLKSAQNVTPQAYKHLDFLIHHLRQAARYNRRDNYSIITGLKNSIIKNQLPIIDDIIGFLTANR